MQRIKRFPFSGLTLENILSHGTAAMSGRDTISRQHEVGFSIIGWSHLADFDDWTD
jgi:hypothetical protein